MAKEFGEAVGEHRLETTSDLGQIDLGGEDEGAIVYLFLPDAVEVRHRVVDWPLPHAPLMTTELWKRFRLSELDVGILLQAFIDAWKAWQRKLRRCVHCKEAFPLGRRLMMHKRTVCHACATEHEGVVF
ncbi:MAG: hypothetical protein QM754_15420 [Tepidisphaeraceae bacterium]